jgi:hypothetical protein
MKKYNKLLNKDECIGKTITKVFMDSGRLILGFDDNCTIAFNGYSTSYSDDDFPIDIIDVCKESNLDLEEELELNFITGEEYNNILLEEDKLIEEQNRKRELKNLNATIKRLNLSLNDIELLINDD